MGKNRRTTAFRREFRSALTEVDAVCFELRPLLEAAGLGGALFRIELLAREFLNNAVIHGNKAKAEKKVLFELRIGRKWILLSVADGGAGFNRRRTAAAGAARRTATCGRGLSIAAAYAARVAYNRRGNSVRIWVSKENNGGLNGKLQH